MTRKPEKKKKKPLPQISEPLGLKSWLVTVLLFSCRCYSSESPSSSEESSSEEDSSDEEASDSDDSSSGSDQDGFKLGPKMSSKEKKRVASILCFPISFSRYLASHLWEFASRC